MIDQNEIKIFKPKKFTSSADELKYEKIHKSYKKRFTNLFENSPNAVRLLNSEGIIIAVNNAFCSMFGMNKNDLLGKPFHVVYNFQGDVEKALEDFKKEFTQKSLIKNYFSEAELSSGKKISFQIKNSFIDFTDEASPYETVLLSVYEQVKADPASTFLSSFIKNSGDAIIGLSTGGRIIYWNNGAYKIYGYSSDEMLGCTIKKLIPPDKQDEIDFITSKIQRQETVDFRETTHITKEGERIGIKASLSPVVEDNVLIGFAFLAKDSAEYQSEGKNDIRESEEKYRSLIETSPDAVVLLDLDGNIIMSNRQVPIIFGFETIDEIYDENIFQYFAENHQNRFSEDFKKIPELGSMHNAEYNLIQKSGEIIPVEINSSIVLDLLGKPKAVSSVIRNISGRKAAEKLLRQSEQQFRSIWENSNDGMRLTDAEGKIFAVNKAFCELVGMPEEEIVGRSFKNIYKYLNEQEEIDSLNRYLSQFNDESFEVRRQFYTTFSSNKKADVDVTYSLLELEEREPVLLTIFHDVTEQKKAERELREAEKLAVIGKMAAYLSHEIKTPLASIKANIEMLGKGIKLSPKKTKSFSIVQREVKRLDKLLKDVLQFARDMELVFAAINLKDLFNYILELHQTAFEEKEIRFIADVDDIKISGDYQKLYSVFLHLIENSIEAIDCRGEIIITSQKNNDGSVSIFVKDSGSGIEKPEKIFEPFYTGKASGTGLGLAIVKKIIEQHNAKISLLSSKPGETIFELIFNS